MSDEPLALVADGDRLLRDVLRRVLEKAGYQVVACGRGREALGKVRERRFDLVILALALPDADGCAVCQRIREASDVPVVMLTAQGGAADVVRALEAGADDCVVKPFQAPELVARLNAVLRRSGGRPVREEPVIRVGDLEIDRRRQRVWVGGKEAVLSPVEFELLYCLALDAGATVDWRRPLGADGHREAAAGRVPPPGRP